MWNWFLAHSTLLKPILSRHVTSTRRVSDQRLVGIAHLGSPSEYVEYTATNGVLRNLGFSEEAARD